MSFTTEQLVNDFAIRSFRDIADGDYIAARFACRSQLVVQYLWASQQAIEKYLKCILLLHRIPATNVKHDLSKGLAAIDNSGVLSLGLVEPSEEFITYLDRIGQYRYMEVSTSALGVDLVRLDRVVWELRRFCTLAPEPRQVALVSGVFAPKLRLPCGQLEKIIDNPKHPARKALLWQNGFFGKRQRKTVKLEDWTIFNNSPLSLNPQILEEVLKYVFLPSELVKAYRNHTGS